jgi:hypothetical protein
VLKLELNHARVALIPAGNCEIAAKDPVQATKKNRRKIFISRRPKLQLFQL